MNNFAIKFKKIYSVILTVFSVIVIIVVCFLASLWYEFKIPLKQTAAVLSGDYKTDSQPVSQSTAEILESAHPPYDNTASPTEKTDTEIYAAITEPEHVQTNAATSSEPSIQENEFIPVCPVQGREFGEYLGGTLKYSSLFDDWREIGGVNISAEVNSPVIAVEDGIVASIKKDKYGGFTAVINHNDGYSSIYENLSTDSLIKEGDAVTREQIISGVGDNKYFLNGEIPFLHYELKKNGKDVNPSDL